VVVDAAVSRFGRCRVAAIGPAAERGVRFSDIVTDRSFAASRGGLGAVMAAKRLKAVVVLAEGPGRDAADPVALAAIARRYEVAAETNPLSRWQHDAPGFGTWVGGARTGTFAVENYRTSRLRGQAGLSAAAFLARMTWSEGGCPGCPTDCVKGFAARGRGASASAASAPGAALHQEAACALGPNLGLVDVDAVLDLNERSIRAGVDPVSLGFAVSFALECREAGLVTDADLGLSARVSGRFGDPAAIWAIVEQVLGREGCGRWLADGVRSAAASVGGDAERYAMHVGGLELSVFEPRTSPMIALGSIVSPTGPRYDYVEHDADFDPVEPAWPHVLELSAPLGLGAPFPMTALTPAKVRAFGILSVLWSAFDALEVCLFASAPTRPLSLDDVAAMTRAVTGWDVSAEEVLDYGRARLTLLRELSTRNRGDDRTLPDRFFDEPIDDGPFAGTALDRAALADARRAFERSMGWEIAGVAQLDERPNPSVIP
jgi:aldehyde:ferredoxin oxidoreductase